ncbi:MAG: amidase domain-containing protein [Clostridia bacterium]|nr:amidase domain-containing protein [Clostridia bacterium]
MPNYEILPYDREAAVAYARRWAFSRNPAYYDFSAIGGDCTNFASQCIYAGAKIMNFTPTLGWFYRSASNRTASWTGVEYLYNFLTANASEGPFAKEVPLSELQRGDIVQLASATGDFYHSPVVVGFSAGEILVAAHSYDAFDKRLSSYGAAITRGLHISGVRRIFS